MLKLKNSSKVYPNDVENVKKFTKKFETLDPVAKAKVVRMIIRLQALFRSRVVWRLYANFYRQTMFFRGIKPSRVTAIGTLFVLWAVTINVYLLCLCLWGISTAKTPVGIPSKVDLQLSHLSSRASWQDPNTCAYKSKSNSCDGPNVSASAMYSQVIRDQQILENHDGNEPPRFSLMQKFPHFEGPLWQAGVIAHCFNGSILLLLFPFVFNDIIVRRDLLKSMANAEDKLKKRFGVWGPKLSDTHHILLGIQMTLGLVLASFRFFKRGFDVYKWYAFVGFQLDLYLQFIALGALAAVSLANVVVLRLYGLDFKGFRSWQRHTLRWVNILSILIQILCTVSFFALCFPVSQDVGFLLAFLFQIPICTFFSFRNITFWGYEQISDRMFLWQTAINRGAMCCVFISFTTFIANVTMAIGFVPGAGIAYLIGNVGWIYGSMQMDEVAKKRGYGKNDAELYSTEGVKAVIEEGVETIEEGVDAIEKATGELIASGFEKNTKYISEKKQDSDL
eukprot:g6471.t1